MYNLQDIEDKIFFECKNILDSLAKINSKDELLLKQDLFYEVSERIAFLKVLAKNPILEEIENTTDNESVQHSSFTVNEFSTKNFHENEEEEHLEEEVIFTNQLNDIDADEIEVENPDIAGDESIVNDVEVNVSSELEELEEAEDETNEIVTEFSEEVEEPSTTISVDDEPIFSFVSEIKIDDVEEPLENSVEEEKEEHLMQEPTFGETELESVEAEISQDENSERRTVVETHVSEHHQVDYTNQENLTADGKIKLANIKSLKNIESLFGDEHFEQTTEVPTPSLIKESYTTLESPNATKSLNEFRLDLNDKLAFSKMLFNGSQADLNEAIRVLNTFDDVEEAKVYLSDLYYDCHWDKVDDYAQRLWTLVENKFL